MRRRCYAKNAVGQGAAYMVVSRQNMKQMKQRSGATRTAPYTGRLRVTRVAEVVAMVMVRATDIAIRLQRCCEYAPARYTRTCSVVTQRREDVQWHALNARSQRRGVC